VNDLAIRTSVIESLRRVAPEADLDDLPGDVELRDELDLDSMDFLNFVVAIGERTGIEIPERDYPEVMTLDACIAYLERRSRRA
jgi:acyl carrier protein